MTEFLSRNNIPFRKRNIREDPSALDELVQAGYQATPVTMIGETGVVGFNPDEIRRLWEAS